ncbi:MAG TPA: helix-turn-helix domain-containing protein [Gemmataceae bacterium]|nr:helix-turn-helix domain-containing protein [Gemmataceae bacterium]
MPQQYYTLEQAAQILRINPEQLKEMARKKEIRAFQDRSGWRFRSQEIDEMARERGYGSDPELPLGEAAKAGDSGRGNEVFNFSLDAGDSDEVPLGKDPAASGSRSAPGSRKTGSSKSPPPKASSDSDVRLVLEGSDVNFAVDPGSSKAPASKGPVSPPPKAPLSPAPKPGSSKSRKAPIVQDESGVRIVPLDQPSDSDVKIEPSQHDSDVAASGKRKPTKKASDSDIRIEEVGQGGKADQMVTEEIDLDAEQRKAEAASSKSGRQRPRPGSSPALPTTSPFELSESDIEVKRPGAGEKDDAETDSSSDFELKPMDEGSDEVGLGELSGGKAKTGINLQDAADSGISLVPESSDEMDIQLSPEKSRTPKPAVSKEEKDSSSDFDLNVQEGDSSPTEGSSSEFELSLQDDDASPTEGSSSEFELSLDAEGSDLAVDEGSSDLAMETPGSDSDSEFELTLDDSGGLSVEQEAADESGSEAVALDEGDTDLESADFDLSLESGEESGSQVVPLEEEYDESAATMQRKAPGDTGAAEEEGLEDLGEELDEDLNEAPGAEEEVEAVAAPAAAAPPADWGVVVPLASLASTLILFFVMLMGFELIQGMWGYHTGNKVSSPIVRFFAKTFSGEDKLPDN